MQVSYATAKGHQQYLDTQWLDIASMTLCATFDSMGNAKRVNDCYLTNLHKEPKPIYGELLKVLQSI